MVNIPQEEQERVIVIAYVTYLSPQPFIFFWLKAIAIQQTTEFTLKNYFT